MTSERPLDGTDARILLELSGHPRATVSWLAERTGLARNTVQARLTALERRRALTSFERRIDPKALGYPLTTYVTMTVEQRLLDEVGAALEEIPEVLQVLGLSGEVDLLAHVVARDADDLYRIAGRILAIPGVERTNTALVMRELVDYRVTPLLHRLTDHP